MAKKGAKKGTAKRGKAKRGTAKKSKPKRGAAKGLAARVTKLETWRSSTDKRLNKVESYSLGAVNAIRRHNGLKPLRTMNDGISKALPPGKRSVAG